MKKFFFVAAVTFILGCNNEKAKEETKMDETKSPKPKVELPFKVNYPGTPSIGKTENVLTVMNFNGDFIAGKLDNLGSYIADSIHLVFEDGAEMKTIRDSAVAMIKTWRESMTSAEQTYISAIAIDNKEMGHQWVFQWIDETHNYKNGKKEHRIYHEDYRLENGKIREFFQYAQAVPEKK